MQQFSDGAGQWMHLHVLAVDCVFHERSHSLAVSFSPQPPPTQPEAPTAPSYTTAHPPRLEPYADPGRPPRAHVTFPCMPAMTTSACMPASPFRPLAPSH